MFTNPATPETAMTSLETSNCFSFTQIWKRLFIAFTIGVMFAQFAGCTSLGRLDPLKTFDEPMAKFRDKVWAARAFNLRYGNCDRAYSDHFKEGFVNGYCNVCQGGQGYVPAMPPETYWETRFQCPEGAKCVNAWFEGFPAGAVAARKDGSGAFHDVYISNMINSAVVQDKAETVLPGDVPITSSRQASDTSSGMTPQMNPMSPAPAYQPSGTIDPSAGMPLPMAVTPASYDYSNLDR